MRPISIDYAEILKNQFCSMNSPNWAPLGRSSGEQSRACGSFSMQQQWEFVPVTPLSNKKPKSNEASSTFSFTSQDWVQPPSNSLFRMTHFQSAPSFPSTPDPLPLPPKESEDISSPTNSPAQDEPEDVLSDWLALLHEPNSSPCLEEESKPDSADGVAEDAEFMSK